ncbi:MAG TPA: diguanylate cyclase, partial [Acidimicrobiales bacterium]|nr:diguanylate cyclase [Acidimicrobiales bacterium]
MSAMPAGSERMSPDHLEFARVVLRAAEAASSSATLEEAAAVVLADLCQLAGWPVGHLYVSGGPDSLVPTATWYLADPERFRVLRQVAQAMSVAAGPNGGLPGRVLASGLAEAGDDVGEAAAQSGLVTAVAVPVVCGREVVAVLHLLGPGPPRGADDATVDEPGVTPSDRPPSDRPPSDGAPSDGAPSVRSPSDRSPSDGPPSDGAPSDGAGRFLEAAGAAADQLGRVVDRRRAAAAEDGRRRLVETANDAFVRLDSRGVIVEWNAQAEAMFGWPRAEVVGQRLSEVVIPARYRAAHDEALRRALAAVDAPSVSRRELAAVHRSGSEFPVEVTVWGSHDDRQRVVDGFVRDISERRRLEVQLARQALHDRLTGLPNRVLLRDRLENALARTLRHRSTVALLILDIDRFKVVNDSLGHEAGDRLLVAVAERLMRLLRPGDTLARMGGDEYA